MSSVLSSVTLEAVSALVAGALVWLSALVQHVTNVHLRGVGYVMSDRSAPPDTSAFFGRATRTLSNNVESALMYAPPVIILVIAGGANAWTHLAAAAYIAARGIFSISYWLKVPAIRSIAWFIGMICCAVVTTYAGLALFHA
jgi:uncharacterized MAPEG superfamily protein